MGHTEREPQILQTPAGLLHADDALHVIVRMLIGPS